jgi:hypothetical protein
MATTTTNFGWDIPQSTDLVKDGATAIAALGQDIDTALVDLKGGTTGQVLAKASATDLDFSWVAQDDSNAIQNAIVDAKGDIIAATAADTPARLAVGANDTVLTADSTTATGLKWAAPAAGGGWTSIASGSLSTGTLSLTSIVGTYKNLRLVVRNMQISANANVQIRINNISTGNYERIGLSNNISTVTTFANGNATEWITTGTTTMKGTSYPASLVIDFPDYTNTTSVKMMQMTSNYEQSTSGEDNTLWAVGSLSVGSGAGLNAISRIDMILSTGTYSTGTYILYGGN